MVNYKLNKFVDKVIFINLEDRIERRNKCHKILESLFEKDKILRFKACQDFNDKKNTMKINGNINCNKSHIECLNLAIKNKWDNVIILEENFYFTGDSEDLLIKILNEDNYDAIVLGGGQIMYNPLNYNLYSSKHCTAYLIKSHYYQTLKNHWSEGTNLLIKTNRRSIYAAEYYWHILMKKDNWKVIYPQIFYHDKNLKSSVNYNKIEDYQIIKNVINFRVLLWKNRLFRIKDLFYQLIFVSLIKFLFNFSIIFLVKIRFAFFIIHSSYIIINLFI